MAGDGGLVKSSSITYASLHKELPVPLRLDVFPFVLAYLGAIYAYLFVDYGDLPILLLFPVIFFFQVLFFLTSYWSVSMRCFITLSGVRTVNKATLIRVVPKENKGSPGIAPLKSQVSIKVIDR